MSKRKNLSCEEIIAIASSTEPQENVVSLKFAKRASKLIERSRRMMLKKQCMELRPLIEALANGHDLKFRHNDNVWRQYKGINLNEIVMFPHRFTPIKERKNK